MYNGPCKSADNKKDFHMLPDFGYALYAEFSDNSRALVAWASERRPLEDAAPSFVRAMSDDIKKWEIVAAHRISITQDADMPYEVVVSDLEPRSTSYADHCAQQQ